jgi:hypothetical protein
MYIFHGKQGARIRIAASSGGMMSGFSGRGPKGVSSDSVAATTKTSNAKYAN